MLASELETVLGRLKVEMTTGEDYPKVLSIAERLHKMTDTEKSSSVSKDVLITVAANLLGILLIIKHENVNVITSKALAFVIRTR